MTAEQSQIKSIPQVGKALVYNADGKILTLYRSKTHPHLAHYVDFPGGEVEGDEDAAVAIAREIKEETGVTVQATQVNIVHGGVSKNSDGKGETRYHLGKAVLADTPELTLSWEHERYEWLSTHDLLKQMATQTDATDTFWDYVVEYLNKSAA
jgi:8-oxo-dGTP pyrophosphatase MutT (NUDIX family)